MMAVQETVRNLQFTSEVPSEVTNIDWNINKFKSLTEIPNALERVHLQFEAGSDIGLPSNWKFFMSQEGDEIGVYLKLLNSPNEVNNLFVKVNMIINRQDSTEYQNAVWTADMKSVDKFGFSNIGSVTTLLSPATNILTADGCLKIQLRFEMYSYITNRGHQENKILKLQELSFLSTSQDFATTFKDGINPDAKLVANDRKEFPVHRVILGARSTIFRTMFETMMQESATGRVEVHDLGSKAMEIVLSYIYTGTLNNTWIEVAAEVINAAEKYELIHLKAYCDFTLINACTNETAVELYKLARLHHLTIATRDILRFIKSNADIVLQ